MPERLQRLQQQVGDLLDRQAVEQQLVEHQHGRRQEMVIELTQRQHQMRLRALLSRIHPADLAQIVEGLPLPRRQLIWSQLSPEQAADLLMELSPGVKQQMVEAIPARPFAELLSHLDSDDLAMISDLVPQHLLAERLEALSHDDRAWLVSTQDYDDDEVGALMVSEMVRVREEHTLNTVLQQLRSLGHLPEQSDKLLVVNSAGQLVGVLPWQQLLLAPAEALVASVMAREVVTFHPHDSAAEAVAAFDRYDLVSAPVVNERGKPIGRITVEAVMAWSQARHGEAGLRHAGMRNEEDLFAPIWHSARNRWAWISLSLLTAFVASRVIGAFEETIAQLVALAALMPIVAAVAGNTGNQTAALVVRGIALGRITATNLYYLLRKEMTLSLLNGMVWGGVVALFALIFYQDPLLSMVIGLAMMLTLLIASLLGVAIPLLLYWRGKDPALGASVLVTAFTDSLGFFIFLALAQSLML
jgi:magnesium transporter